MAPKQRSLFNGKAQRKPATVSASLPNDPVSLDLRSDRRRHLDLHEVELSMCYETSNPLTPIFKREFSGLVERFPHHGELVRQLLAGFNESPPGNRRAAFQTYQNSALAIEYFVEFINSNEPLAKNVFCTADINLHAAKTFNSWLLRTSPGRANNRKLYGAIRQAVLALQRKHSHLPRVGKEFVWPAGPRTNEQVSESYPLGMFNLLVDSCLSDMAIVMHNMKDFTRRIKSTPRFVEGDGLIHHSQEKIRRNLLGSTLSLEQSEWMAFATAWHLYPNWPLCMELMEASDTFADKFKEKIETASERAKRVIRSSRFGSVDSPMAVGQLAYFSYFSFTSATIYPFLLFVQLNTGWNLETILALSDCLDDHIEPDIIDKHYCIIYSSKNRNESSVSHRSNMKSPFGVYRILRFVESQIIRHKNSPHYIPCSLWQFILTKNLWAKCKKIVSSVDGRNASTLSRAFLQRHKIKLGSSRKYQSLEFKRLRTTYLTRRREQGLSTEMMTDLMGHADIDTTAQNYDSDAGSNAFKNKTIRTLQNANVADFTHYRARLVQSTSLQELRDAIGVSSSVEDAVRVTGIDSTSAIIHMLSPEGQTYIAACLDATAPSWPEAGKFLSVGDSCRYFNRCCMCDKAVIFKESLPWVIRRIRDLEDLRLQLSNADWTVNYAEELVGWNWIISNWSNQSDIANAQILASNDTYRLPLTMRGV